MAASMVESSSVGNMRSTFPSILWAFSSGKEDGYLTHSMVPRACQYSRKGLFGQTQFICPEAWRQKAMCYITFRFGMWGRGGNHFLVKAALLFSFGLQKKVKQGWTLEEAMIAVPRRGTLIESSLWYSVVLFSHCAIALSYGKRMVRTCHPSIMKSL